MFRGSRIFKRILFFLLVLFVITAAALYTAATVYKDELISHFISTMNERLNTPVNVGEMDVSAFANFPYISLLLHDVDVRASDNADESLLQAERIDFTINPLTLLFSETTFERVSIINGRCRLYTDPRGIINYQIFRNPSNDSTSEAGSINLSRISLQNVDFTYDNDQRDLLIQVLANHLTASVQIHGRVFNIWADGNILADSIVNRGMVLVEGLQTSITSELIYDDKNKSVTINPSIIQPGNTPLLVKGQYEFGLNQNINLTTSAATLEASVLLDLLPPSLRQHLASYAPTGVASCELNYLGSWTENSGPALDIDFTLENVNVTHQATREQLTRINSRGRLEISNTSDLSSGKISLLDLSAYLNDEKITGEILLNNFTDPYISLNASGRISLARLLKFYPLKPVEQADGFLDVDLAFSGATQQMNKKEFLKRIRTNGSVTFEDVALHLRETRPYFSNINGTLTFDNNNLIIDRLSGDFGNSDFVLQGDFRNAMAYMIYENESIGIDAHLTSEFIDMDELLSLSPQKDRNTPYSLSISNRIKVHFDCEIDRLSFRRFHPTDIRGDFKIRNQVAFSDQLKFRAMGGEMDLLGMADASRDNLVRVSTNARFKNISADSVFYVFENFSQDWLTDKHLKGSINADISAAMMLSNHLKLYPETLRAHISTSIIGGELNDFEPLQKLSPYLDESELRHLKFSELRNEILIKDRTIYLPEMEIGSNATDLIISGTHTFDQRINYEIRTPLVRRVRYDPDEAFGAIEKDASGRSMLYLKIVGTTSSYYVNYDKDNVKRKIASDLQKEKEELRDIFKNKGKTSREVELAEDEYFDWDEDDDGTRR